MKKFIFTVLFALIPLMLTTSAMAGGGAGPSKDMRKGVIISVDAAAHTLEFVRDDNGAHETLAIPSGLDVTEDMMNRKVLINLVHLEEHGETAAHAGAAVREIKDVEIMFLTMTGGRLLALMCIGAIGGLLSGFIGSGGAFVMTPAMMSLGAPGAVAVASNMCHKFPKAMVGAYKRWKYGQADIKLGLVMASSAIVGVQIGIQIQKFILAAFGGAGSNLYISVVFLVVLIFVGGYVMMDALKLMKSGDSDDGEVKTGALALKMQSLKIPPMITFKSANITISLWITLPVGILTGMLAATIAVGGFIGVPGLIYVMGVSAVAASATELVIAFVMGCWGSIQWGLAGLIDIRLTVLLLSCSLIGVQLGALGTTYVKDYIIKLVMASTMLIVAVSRGAKVPGYLIDLGWMSPMSDSSLSLLNNISFYALLTALGTAGLIIIVAMIKGMTASKAQESAVSYSK